MDRMTSMCVRECPLRGSEREGGESKRIWMLVDCIWLGSKTWEKLAQKQSKKTQGNSNQKANLSTEGRKMSAEKQNLKDMHGGNEGKHPCIIGPKQHSNGIKA